MQAAGPSLPHVSGRRFHLAHLLQEAVGFAINRSRSGRRAAQNHTLHLLELPAFLGEPVFFCVLCECCCFISWFHKTFRNFATKSKTCFRSQTQMQINDREGQPRGLSRGVEQILKLIATGNRAKPTGAEWVRMRCTVEIPVHVVLARAASSTCGAAVIREVGAFDKLAERRPLRFALYAGDDLRHGFVPLRRPCSFLVNRAKVNSCSS